MSKYKDLTKEKLLEIVEQQDKELQDPKKYGLFWDKEKVVENVVADCENNLPVLKRIGSKEIKTDDSEDNILIEGDNYHALNVLNYTHRNKIDIIYIDPPYNTGNKDFIYNDKFIDKENGYRHSMWLNFMEKRLILAKNLLKSTGVIFISIDDNEESQLKMLSDKIFNEKNFIAKIIIQSNPRGSQSSNHFATTHEYVLAYAKFSENLSIKGFEKSDINIQEYSSIDSDGARYRLLGLRQRGGEWRREQRPKMFYPIFVNPQNGEVSLESDKKFSVQSLPQRPTGEDGRWTWSKEKFNLEKELLIGKKVKRKGQDDFYDIFRKDYLVSINGENAKAKPKTIWIDKELNYQNGRDEIKEIFGKDLFDYPKPTHLIKRLIEMVDGKNNIVLDFFAGSGTTGHAVLKLNKEDSGNRKFILCTNNEGNICDEITYPRIQKLLKGYNFSGNDKTIIFEKRLTFSKLENVDNILQDISETIENTGNQYNQIKKELREDIIKVIGIKNIKGFKDGLGGNLKYFKTDFVKNTNNRDQLKINLTKKCTEILCVKENIFNLKKAQENYKIFTSNDGNRHLCIYYNFIDKDFDNFVKDISKLNGAKAVYIFALNNKIDKKEFKGIPDVSFEAIPYKILEVYEQLVKISKK